MRIVALLLLLLTPACGAQENQKEELTADTSTQSSDRVVVEPTKRTVDRNELAIAVGADCKAASRSEFKGSAGDQDFYALQCQNKDFLVSVKLDGSTNVLDCGFAEKMGTPCWKSW